MRYVSVMSSNATRTLLAKPGDLDVTPALDFPRPGRLPSDFAPLAAWLATDRWHECRVYCRGRVWWAELFNRDTCVASVGHADPAVALARALEEAVSS